MPLFHDRVERPPAPQVVVHGSVATELEWVLASADRNDFQRDHPTLHRVYASRPELRARVRGLWPDAAMSCGGFVELMIVAHHAGLHLSMDPAAVLGDLEAICASAPDGDSLGLLSETEADRRVLVRRLESLRTSAPVRQAYAAVLRETWDAVGEDWERSGRPAVEQAVEARRQLVARGAGWREVARTDCDCDDLLEHTVTALPPDGQLLVVPAFFAHLGLLIDLPGAVVVGTRADTSGVDARARTETLARRLKTISDPTRLAILDTLRRSPRTVTELAGTFALAQPTVSNHVKLLRDAGLVTDERDGARRHLVVRAEAMDDLLESLRSTLAPAPTDRSVAGPIRPAG
jgi:DNA-binding transcriptional ArsR family regulator